jgi:hypothetical protein
MKKRCQQRPVRRGYVLLTTLALLVLASTLLVAVGRSAVDRTLLARQTQANLQRKWGTISARSALLPHAEEILSRLEAGGGGGVPTYRTDIELAGDEYTLIISDEQAKANVNVLLDDSEKSDVEARIRESLTGSGIGNAVLLHPAQALVPTNQPQDPADQNAPTALITGLGQIFNNLPPERLAIGSAQAGAGAAANITCWGNGAINIMRAPEAALRLALGQALTKLEISRLVTQRDFITALSRADRLPGAMLGPTTPANNDPDPVNRLLNLARIGPEKRNRVSLTSHSSCFSLWIVMTDPHRSWSSLYVSDTSNPAATRAWSFVW